MALFSLERYVGTIVISEQTQYISVEIYVDFITGRPTSALKLVFKDHAGIEHKSNKFKQSELVHWNIDLSVHSQPRHSFLEFD
jgi:hypothetical protein